MSFKNLKQFLAVTILSSIVTGVFAEDAAPVYDVDNYPPQFDGGADAAAQAPSPPEPPSQATSHASSQISSSEPDLQPQLQSEAQTGRQAAPPAVEELSAAPLSTSLSLEQRMRRVEQQVNNAQQSTVTSKVDALQSQVQSLRGQVEELTHQLQQLRAQQQAMFSDVDKRLHQQAVLPGADSSVTAPAMPDNALKISASTATAASTTKTPAVSSSTTAPLKSAATSAPSIKSVTDNQPNVAEEQQIYQTAYDLIKAKKYTDAVAALQKMLQKYPTGQFAANAHYWLGELYGLLNKNDLSAQEFSTVVKTYPTSPKVADAQLKVGLIYAGQFKWVDAKSAFKKVINQYPGTSSARLAAEQLKQIKLAGH